jgi:hypothetical protein
VISDRQVSLPPYLCVRVDWFVVPQAGIVVLELSSGFRLLIRVEQEHGIV